MADPASRAQISRQVCAWLDANALILDTETTGLDDDAEVVELAVIDCAGTVLLDTLVRPSGPVPAEAAAIHGITDAMLADAPTWSEIHARFCDLHRHLRAMNLTCTVPCEASTRRPICFISTTEILKYLEVRPKRNL